MGLAPSCGVKYSVFQNDQVLAALIVLREYLCVQFL